MSSVMAIRKAGSSLPLLFLSIFLLSFNPGSIMKIVNADTKTWCVAKPSADAKALQEIINFVCHEIECSVINYGCPCYEPNSLINHASIVMNLYYQKNGRNNWNCVFKGNGLTTVTNPSYGRCTYE